MRELDKDSREKLIDMLAKSLMEDLEIPVEDAYLDVLKRGFEGYCNDSDADLLEQARNLGLDLSDIISPDPAIRHTVRHINWDLLAKQRDELAGSNLDWKTREGLIQLINNLEAAAREDGVIE